MTVSIEPGTAWHEAANRLRPGQDLALAPGDHAGGLVLTRGGSPGAPVVIRAQDPRSPPRILPVGDSPALVDVAADDVVLRSLAFRPTPTGVHAVILRGASRVTVQDCQFEGIGGLAIVETMSARDVVIRGNRIRRSRTTAMYFGCHRGSCSILDLLIESNCIEEVTAPARAVGYGIQIKLNSCAVVRDNLVLNTKGPAIMVYGARRRAQASLVERNLVAGSRRSAGIVIAGGPATVRDNVAMYNAGAGIALEDYARRGLLRDVRVTGNIVFGNGRDAIVAPPTVPGAVIVTANYRWRPG